MISQSKVILICCYFGKLPNYFELWLRSCRENPKFSWLIFTDDDKKYDCPANVKIVNASLNDIKERIRKYTGIDEDIRNAYKLCDFKPLYGIIFQDFLITYTHWGHCDLDLIWGKLDHFIDDTMLNNYDRLFPKGHLVIYKNNKFTNMAYKLDYSGVDYLEVLESQYHYGFDEYKGINKIYRENGLKWYNKDLSADIDFYKFNLMLRGKANFKNQHFMYKDGAIYRVDQNMKIIDEFPYIHLQKREMNMCEEAINSNCFMIGENLFYTVKPRFNIGNNLMFSIRQKICAIIINTKWNIHWRKKYKKASKQS